MTFFILRNSVASFEEKRMKGAPGCHNRWPVQQTSCTSRARDGSPSKLCEPLISSSFSKNLYGRVSKLISPTYILSSTTLAWKSAPPPPSPPRNLSTSLQGNGEIHRETTKTRAEDWPGRRRPQPQWLTRGIFGLARGAEYGWISKLSSDNSHAYIIPTNAILQELTRKRGCQKSPLSALQLDRKLQKYWTHVR